MGNTHCLAEPVESIDDETVAHFGPAAQSYSFEVPDLQGDFLKLHLHERSEKYIVDPKLVVDVLAHQAGELIRRELEQDRPPPSDPYGMRHQASSLVSTSSTPSEIYSTSDLTGIFSSVAPSTASNITSCSASTRLAGNYNRYSPSRKRFDEEPYAPPRLLGNGVDLDDTLHQDLITVIEGIDREEEMKKRFPLIESQRAAGCNHHPGCSLVPLALMPRRPRNSSVSSRASRHMVVLHLRLIPRCAEFYESHLSRFLPDNPFVKAMSNGINSSELTPTRNFPRKSIHIPELMRNDSDSASSLSTDVDFGAGPPSLPVRILVNDAAFLDLGITGSLGLIEPRRPDVQAQRGRRFITPPKHYLVLLNRRSGTPLAVCALRTGETGDPIVRVYATKPRTCSQQRPVATTRKLGLDWTKSLPLYAWAEIVTKGRYPSKAKYSIFYATGDDARFDKIPSFIAEHSSVGSPEIRVLGMTERESGYTGCAVLCLSRDYEVSEDDLYFRLSVSKGVDPGLFICFAAFVDEAMERTMRIQS